MKQSNPSRLVSRRAVRALAAVTGTALAFGGLATAPAFAADELVTIDIVTINDFHGRIEADRAVGGAARLSTAVKSVRAENPNTVFAAAGDLIGASTFTSFIQQDEPTIEALNLATLDVSAAGNHEFDQGWEDLRDRVQGLANWEYISANVFLKDTDTTALAPSWVTTIDGVNVGFIGAVTEELDSLVSPEGIADLEVRDIAASVNLAADALTDGDPGNGEADILILLVHEGATTTAVDSITPDSALGRIVYGVNDKVDAIVSAHTHLAYNHVIDGRPVISAGQYGENFGRMTITYDATAGAIVDISNQIHEIAPYDPDPALEPLVEQAKLTADALGNVEVGKVSGDLTRAQQEDDSENRGGESTLGNFIADVHRWATGADIAVMNPGGIRTDIMYGDDGAVTYRQAASVQPFANTLMTLDLTGAQLIQLLEEQWQPEGSSRPFLKLGVSENVFYTYDPNAAAGSHITSVLIDGVPVDESAVYSVGANSFLAAGGDNFFVLADGANRADSGQIDMESMVTWMQAFEVAHPDLRQRAVGVAITAPGANGYEVGSEVTLDLSSLSFSRGADAPASVTLELGGVAIGSADIDPTIVSATDESGRASITFAVPAGLTGPLDLTVEAGETVFTLPFEVAPVAAAPTLTLGAAEVEAGDSLTLSGHGYVPGEQLSVVLAPGGIVLGTVTVDEQGAFSGSFIVPAELAAGRYVISMSDGDLYLATAELSVTAVSGGGSEEPGDGGSEEPGTGGTETPGAGEPGTDKPGTLPATGVDPTAPLLIALLLLLAGGGLVVVRRTRRA